MLILNLLFIYICCIFLFFEFCISEDIVFFFSFKNSYTPVTRFFPAIYVLKAPWARQLLRRATHPFFPQSIRSAPLPNHRHVRRPCNVDPGIAWATSKLIDQTRRGPAVGSNQGNSGPLESRRIWAVPGSVFRGTPGDPKKWSEIKGVTIANFYFCLFCVFFLLWNCHAGFPVKNLYIYLFCIYFYTIVIIGTGYRFCIAWISGRKI